MRQKLAMMFVLLALAAAPAALAGEKCPLSTQDCLDHMATKMKNSGWVGVELDTDKSTGGLAVTKVIPGSPAEKAGIQIGDLLMAINGIEYNEANAPKLRQQRSDSRPGDSVTWTMKRDGDDKEFKITLGRMPADLLARYIGEHMMEHVTPQVAKN